MTLFFTRYLLWSILAALLFLAGCQKKQAPTPAPVEDATLQSAAHYPVGAAISVDLLRNNVAYSALVSAQYSSITTENVLKFDAVEPGENQFNFADGDYIVNFAKQQHKRLHAHNFIWHQALPTWVINFNGDSLAWENLFKTHIETEAAHYKGLVASWDVVNEAIRDDDGTLRNRDVSPGDGSIWRRHLGPDYIARAFQYAHEADPGALLFYNDYGQEWNGQKLNAIIALVSSLKNRGIPIDGIGMQMHIDINADNNNMLVALQRLVTTGLKIHISELDIAVNPGNDANFIFNDALNTAQLAKFQYVAHIYNMVPAAQQYGITTWNVSDGDSWIPRFYNRKDYPLLFDANYQKKQAFYGFLTGLKN